MSHGGYHGTQIIGGKITQLGDEFKDDSGNILDKYNVTGDRDSGFNVTLANETFDPRSREAMYASPDDILQNIIDRKDVLKLQQSPDRPGMNLYQDTIQDFRTSNPTNMSAYASRFPLTQFMMEGPKAIAENTLIGRFISQMGKGKDAVTDFAGNVAGGLFPDGFMPGLGPDVERFTSQLAAAPGNFAKDFKAMFTLEDDNPVKTEVRNVLDVKKNTAEDISEGSIFPEIKTEANVYGGRSPSDELYAQSTLNANPSLQFGRQFTRMERDPEFKRYLQEVEKRLGVQ